VKLRLAPGQGLSLRAADSDDRFDVRLRARQRAATTWQVFFLVSTIVGIVALSALLYTIADRSFGYVAVQNKVPPEQLTVDGVPVEQQPAARLASLLRERLSSGVLRRLDSEAPLEERSQSELYQLVLGRVIEPEIKASWTLTDSLIRPAAVRAQAAAKYPGAGLQFRSWLSLGFLRHPQSGTPADAGVRTAILGSLWTIAITILVAFPIGVGAAIYLEEYAANNALKHAIQMNISNLAGVPSIIYGILGLAIFVRDLEPLRAAPPSAPPTQPPPADAAFSRPA